MIRKLREAYLKRRFNAAYKNFLLACDRAEKASYTREYEILAAFFRDAPKMVLSLFEEERRVIYEKHGQKVPLEDQASIH